MRGALLAAAFLLPTSAFADCETDVAPPTNMQDFYPPGSIRRNETGAVTLELTIKFGEAHPVAVRIVTSSGYPDLDARAVKLANVFAIRSDCLDALVKRTVHFEKEPDPPRSSYTDHFRAGDTCIWVED